MLVLWLVTTATDPGRRLGRHLWVHHAGWHQKSWSRWESLKYYTTLYSYLLATVEHSDIEAGMHKVACWRGRPIQQLVTCQHNMGEVGRAKPLAMFIRRDCLICRCMEKFPTSSVTHLKSRVSTKFPCSIEEKFISGTNIHNMYIYSLYYFWKSAKSATVKQKKKFIIIYVLLLPLVQCFKYWNSGIHVLSQCTCM